MDKSFGDVQWLVFLTILVIPGAQPSDYQTTDTQDKIIQSAGYPGSYPTDANVTWHWRTKSGQWAIVIFDFMLDKSVGRDEDWLEIDDGNRQLRYTNSTPPPKDLITEGAQLSMRFVSNEKTDPVSRGFRLLVLFDNSESNLHLRIHEAREIEEKRNSKGNDDGGDQKLVIILATTLLVLLIIIAVLVIIYVMHRRRETKNSFDIPASPRVRRDSGISHTRNGSFRQPGDISQRVQQQQQQQQQQPIHQPPIQQQQVQQHQQHPQRQRSTSRSSQRRQLQHQTSVDSVALEEYTSRGARPSRQRSSSNQSGQMNWILRAELSTALQSPDRRSKPNLYTSPPEVATAKSRKTSVTSCVSSPEMTVPYVDVMTPIPDNSAGTSHQNGDYDNFESIFNHTNENEMDQSLNQTWPSCDNVYTNTDMPPAYGVDISMNNLNIDKKDNTYSLQKIVPSSTPKQASNNSNQLTAPGTNDTLYVNVHLSSSQKDIRSGEGACNQGENEVYSNIAIGLMGMQSTTVLSVSNDSLSFAGSNSSLNKIVLSVKQEKGTGQATRNGGGVTSATSGPASNVYDIPPPISGAARKNSKNQDNDAYIKLNDIEMNSQNRAAANVETNRPIASNSPSHATGGSKPITNQSPNILANTVIPADTSKQVNAYDVPRSARKL